MVDPSDDITSALALSQTRSPFLDGLEANLAAGVPTATITLADPPDRARLDAALRRVGISPTEDLRGPCWLALDLLDAARAAGRAAELALQKRQATVDRQGNELGRLRDEVQRLQSQVAQALVPVFMPPSKPSPLPAGPFSVVAHYQGHPMAEVCLRAPTPAEPVTIHGSTEADFDCGLHGARVVVYGDERVLMAHVVDRAGGTTAVPLHYGERLEFGDTVLHFLPDGPTPASLYKPSGEGCDDLLDLDAFMVALNLFKNMTPEVRAEAERRAQSERRQAPAPRYRMVECRACYGTGSVGGDDACFNCGGTGAIEEITD